MSKNLKLFLAVLALISVGLSLAIFFTFKTLNKKSTDILKLSPAPIDTNYLYQSINQGFAVYIGNHSKKQSPEIKFAVENSSIYFKPEGGIYDQTKLTKQNEKSIVYKNVSPGVDFLYTLIKNGIKEEIIINNQQAAVNNPQFTFKLNLKNAVPQEDLMNDSAVTFVDSVSGNYLFHFEKPFMIDAGGNRSDNVQLKIQRSSVSDSVSFDDNNSSSFQIIIIPDNNWLKAALYPVVIDPTVVLDNADTVANWTSSNPTYFTASQDTIDKQEGTGSIQVAASSGTPQQVFNSSTTWTVPAGVTSVEVLVVAGGGSGGSGSTAKGSGGGAGGLVYGSAFAVNAGNNLTVTIGAGGAGVNAVNPGNIGGNSVFDTLIALGGGIGVCNGNAGGNGGSAGGGASTAAGAGAGGAATQPGSASGGFGCNGGNGWGGNASAGGGGGAGAVGQNGAQLYAGAGGAGKDYSAIFGTGVGVLGWFAGGGGGTCSLAGQGAGGKGGGGKGGRISAPGSGTANTGGGGGGGSGSWTSGAGGSGVVIIKYTVTSLNSTLTRDLGAGGTKDLSGHSSVTFWVKSTRTGTYLQFGMGESAWNDNTTNVTINSANTWEQKTWDISGISAGAKDAIRYLGFKVTNADTDFTMKFDDIKIVNLSPTAPTSLLTEGQTNPTGVTDTTPEFSAIFNDDSGDIANKYRIQVDDASGFGSTIWDSGASGTAMSNCNQGARCQDISYAGSVLAGNTTYYWRIKYWDNEGAEGAWSTVSAYFTTSVAPLASTSLLAEGLTNPTGVTDTTPEFSATYNDDAGDIANKYRIQVDDDSGFSSPIWDSGASGIAMTNCNQGNRCADISYAGVTPLSWNTKYYWRIKYWDQFGLEGAWSTESAYFTMFPIYEPTSCMIDDSGQSSQLIVKWADNTNLETGYRIEKNVDNGAWTLLSTEAANTVSKTDTDVSANHTYLYRIRANSDQGNSQWCSTSQVDYSKGNLQMKGLFFR